MGISTNAVAAARRALEQLRDDRVMVRRIDPESAVLEEQTVYEALPCHLSRSSLPLSDGQDDVGKTVAAYTVYAGPSADIRAGDRLIVTHKGQTIEGVAGKPFQSDFNLSVALESVAVS